MSLTFLICDGVAKGSTLVKPNHCANWPIKFHVNPLTHHECIPQTLSPFHCCSRHRDLYATGHASIQCTSLRYPPFLVSTWSCFEKPCLGDILGHLDHFQTQEDNDSTKMQAMRGANSKHSKRHAPTHINKPDVYSDDALLHDIISSHMSLACLHP